MGPKSLLARVSAAAARRTEVRKLREIVGDVGHEVSLVAQMGVPARTVGVPWTPSALVSARWGSELRHGQSLAPCRKQGSCAGG
jgi:hypothetical protein